MTPPASMSSSRLVCCALCAAFVVPALGNYADDTGYNQLKAELGDAMLAGNGVGVSQIEAEGTASAYMAHVGTGTFPGTGIWAGKIFTAKSGPAQYSSHAAEVAQ